MKWIPQDIDMYLKSKEYVDTAVIPLSPVSFGDEMKQSAAMTEFTGLLTSYLERQFTGRLLLLPAFTYFKNVGEEKVIADIREWEINLKNSDLKHIFYVTSDSNWKMREDKLEGSVIWLPTLPLEQMDNKQRISILEDQVKQILHLFIQKWREGEK
jgi:hypothetical protein